MKQAGTGLVQRENATVNACREQPCGLTAMFQFSLAHSQEFQLPLTLPSLPLSPGPYAI